VESRTSSSRPRGFWSKARARPSKRSVSPDIAETTTTIWWPSACQRATRSATAPMRSTSPTEVPPNFWTMRDIWVLSHSAWVKRANGPLVHSGLHRGGAPAASGWARPDRRTRRAGNRESAQAFADPIRHRGQCAGELPGFGTAGLRHVGASTAFAAGLLADEVRELTGVDAVGQGFGNARDDAYFIILDRCEHHDGMGE